MDGLSPSLLVIQIVGVTHQILSVLLRKPEQLRKDFELVAAIKNRIDERLRKSDRTICSAAVTPSF
jgi:hypothetical protein